MQKELTEMNVLVHNAVTDITGKTGLAIIRDIVRGARDPRELAKPRDYRCKKSEAEIAKALTGDYHPKRHSTAFRASLPTPVCSLPTS